MTGLRRALVVLGVVGAVLLGVGITIGVEANPAEPSRASAHEQRADRGVNQIVGRVNESLGDGRIPESTVDLGWNRHPVSSFRRRRRTPLEAAWRAASSLDPSAPAISAYGRS